MIGNITSRMPRAEYDKIQALNMSRLKEMRRSPQHYKFALEQPREISPAMILGQATHTAVLEPERFLNDYAIWDKVLSNGRNAPRNGGAWDQFKELHANRVILTKDEGARAQAIAKAVRFDENANVYLATGDPEVTLQWSGKREFKGRIDWFAVLEGAPTLVGLKTARDCRHFLFAAQAARLGYHLQWAFYYDGFEAITGTVPHMVEIVVESEPPHAVATYLIPRDIIDQGRDEYQACLKTLEQCEASDTWPGPVPEPQYLTLPSWAYGREDDDISDLGLEALNA